MQTSISQKSETPQVVETRQLKKHFFADFTTTDLLLSLVLSLLAFIAAYALMKAGYVRSFEGSNPTG